MHRDPYSARILVVDDEPVNTVLLGRVLAAAGYGSVRTTTDPLEALELFDEAAAAGTPFDLVCTDLHMPRMTGLDVVREVAARVGDRDFLPIVVLTADVTQQAEQEALALGAHDFITKPFKPPQIRLRVANLLRTRSLHVQLQRHADDLEDLVRERTIELEAARLDVLDRLAAAAEYRDYATGRHTQRVGLLASLIAAELGCDRETVDLLRRAAPLHDVGKIGIPDAILLKPGKLSDDEFQLMQEHVDVGARLLAHGQSKLIAMAEEIAWTHHERWDGSGYPRRLRGQEIPLVGQIVAVADVFDTLVSERPYKPAWPLDEAVTEMRRQRGRWFAPRLVDAFFAVLEAHPEIGTGSTESAEPGDGAAWDPASVRG